MIERELADSGAGNFRKVRAAAEYLTHVVSERADVGAGRALDGEASDGAVDFGEAIFEEFDGGRFEDDSLIFTGEFVGGTASDFLGRKNWRHLVETADGLIGELLELFAIEGDGNFRRQCGSFGVVGVGGEAEAEAGGVAFAPTRIETDEAGGLTEEQDKNASSQRIEGTEMADLAETGEMTEGIDDVVGGFALGLVDDEGAVEGSRLWLARHERSNQ